MMVVRVVAAVIMAFAVGTVMSFVFERNKAAADISHSAAGATDSARIIEKRGLILILLIVLSLLVPNYLGAGRSYAFKLILWGALTAVLIAFVWRAIPGEEVRSWLRETGWFVRIIFPLLLAGVFLVGIIGSVLPEPWIEQWLGGNGLRASFLATLIGSVTYFATMTEAPFVDTLMDLGMGRGPAMALLLTGPGLSLPNWLAIARVFGWRQALVYVPTIVVLGTLAGWFTGNVIF